MVVSNNSEFDSLVQQYVIGGGAPAVSFDISDNVNAQSYGHILDNIIANNKNLDRLDKIENPRYEDYPRPIVSCYTVREGRWTKFTGLLAVLGGSSCLHGQITAMPRLTKSWLICTSFG
ncbi:hypothetical protein QL285_048428 [Trifolium repens]|nr:hypothetical protein QL285_048428 [Trifolium repens]